MPWQMLWPYRRRIYADWLFWVTIGVIVLEIEVTDTTAVLIGWGFGAVWSLVALARMWRT